MKYEKSKLTVLDLKKMTQNTMFKRPINKRKKEVGKVKYLGWSKEVVSIGNQLNAVINLYFTIESAPDKKGNRYKYLEILEIPYKKEYKSKFNKIYTDYIKVFSSDPSFKYFLAYALNQYNSVVLNKNTIKWLGKALTKKPTKRNKKLHKELNKHFYKLIEFISKRSMGTYLSEKYYLGLNFNYNIDKIDKNVTKLNYKK